jgi:hypothetical protein
MSRPKPKILLSKEDSKTNRIEEIIEVSAIYAVFYDNCPINIKWSSEYVDDVQPKYRKTSFPSEAHAHNLADRLNKKFNTDKFTVVKLSNGEIVNRKTE